MPCFVCEKCGSIDNTALGHYWSRNSIFFEEGSLSPELVGKPLCFECIPEKYSDGSKAGVEKSVMSAVCGHIAQKYQVKDIHLLKKVNGLIKAFTQQWIYSCYEQTNRRLSFLVIRENTCS